MNKKTVIYISCAVILVIAVALVLYFTVFNKNENSTGEEQNKINIITYDENFDVDKTIEITNKKDKKEIEKICNNISLEQDDEFSNRAVRNDVKVELGNNRFIMIQLDISEYCYYEDSNSNTKIIIKMPEGLLDKVNQLIAE